jgi:hypothetical protein
VFVMRVATSLRSARTPRLTIELVMRGALMAYSPTRPVRLMSVSSMSSVVDIARAAAW